MTTIAFIVAAYLIGSLSFAVIVQPGDGPGRPAYLWLGQLAPPMCCAPAKTAAALTLPGGWGEGWVAVVLAQWQDPFCLRAEAGGMVALAVMAGHIWPLFLVSRRQGV